MNDSALADPLVLAFEQATLDPTRFHHREHLYVAWCYLRALPLEDALARYVRHLRALVKVLGAEQKFHRTLTWAWLVRLDEAMRRAPEAAFDALAAELSSADALHAYFPPELLDSAEARRHFVLPRRT
ncbi:MAG: hypothetical protein ACOZQL_31760 [Myxococcota bacterium]